MDNVDNVLDENELYMMGMMVVWKCVRKGYPAELTAAHYLIVIPNGTASCLRAMLCSNLEEAQTEKRLANKIIS